MVSIIALSIAGAGAYWIISSIINLRKNIAAAKASGLPYCVSPIDMYNLFWMVTHKFWLPFIERLPSSWTEEWLPYVVPNWLWQLQYEPFLKMGDVFLLVSPGSIQIWVANAEAIHQITSRRDAFPKPTETYQILNLFGRNILSTEGPEWKSHRKVTSPGFNEKNNVLVFEESCQQTQGMLRKWTGQAGSNNITLDEVPADAMRLTLHIISRIGFGVRLLWPGEQPDVKSSGKTAVYGSHDVPEGHSMSFTHALDTLLEHMLWVLVTPKWLLKRLPMAGARTAFESFVNWGQYMNELFVQKLEEAREGTPMQGMDIMGSLVRSSYGKSEANMDGKSTSVGAEKPEGILSDSDILGDAFVMIVAGHETTANSIHFSLMELAINPYAQRMVQKEVQSIFGHTPPEEWDYDSSINALLGGFVGAVLNEQLRLMPPVVAIPKHIPKGLDQTIFLNGREYTLPAGTNIALAAAGVQRSPKYWPTQPSKVSSRSHDLYDFRPERWLVKKSVDGTQQFDNLTKSEEDEEFGGSADQYTSGQLFRPVKGSYIPFSEGSRSCLGRRLAQVEVMAILAVIFQNYSIELAVDEWVTDDEVAKMNDDEKRAVYGKAQNKARATIRSATTIITLKLHPGYIPVRVVKKGEERFLDIIE